MHTTPHAADDPAASKEKDEDEHADNYEKTTSMLTLPGGGGRPGGTGTGGAGSLPLRCTPVVVPQVHHDRDVLYNTPQALSHHHVHTKRDRPMIIVNSMAT